VLKLIDNIRQDEPRVGTRKLQDRLHKIGMRIGRDQLFGILRKSGRLVKVKKRFEKTTYSQHTYAVAPNLIKELKVVRPWQVVVSDCTYLRLAGREFAYLFLVTDLFTRRIVGYHVSRDLSHYSAVIALENAVRGLSDSETAGMIHHSDRGCQYCCHEYLRTLKAHGILSSMTDADHCYQNAIAERVNGILKDEFNLDAVFRNFEQLRAVVTHAVLIYNTKRTHWSLGLRTPMEMYEQAA